MYFSNSSPSIVNCIINGNTANAGAGIYFSACTTPSLTNCTIVRNTAAGGGAGGGVYCYHVSSTKIVNSILWQNPPNEIGNNYGNPVVTNSDVLGGYTGTGNINVDPLFVNINAGPDLRLTSLSKCIDTGDKTAPDLPPTDKDGNPRVNNSKVDMGAYEYQGVPSTVVYADFGSFGLWKYFYGDWAQLTQVSPDKMLLDGDKFFASFSGYGLYQYDGANWTLLAATSAENMAAGSGKLYVDFGSLGLWAYDGAWTQLTPANPDNILTFGNKLLVNFPDYGLYQYDGSSWTSLATYDGALKIVGADLP
jgi:hypothetical protein